jgi:uncharacterized Tic20 family protein
MPFLFDCPHCKAKLRAAETLVGKPVQCPRCSHVAPVPQLSSVAATPEECPEWDDEPSQQRPGGTSVEEIDVLPEVEDGEPIEEEPIEDALPADDERGPRRGGKKRKRKVTPAEQQLALFIYLLAIFTGFLGPLILWLIKRDELKFVNHHGKEVLNFCLTLLLASVILGMVGVPLILLTFGLLALVFVPLAMILSIYALVTTIVGAMKANRGEWWEFPLSIRMIR